MEVLASVFILFCFLIIMEFLEEGNVFMRGQVCSPSAALMPFVIVGLLHMPKRPDKNSKTFCNRQHVVLVC